MGLYGGLVFQAERRAYPKAPCLGHNGEAEGRREH